jgi:N6-adenosine-specific RNA methylase IME4
MAARRSTACVSEALMTPWPFIGIRPGSARSIYADPAWTFQARSAKGEGRSPQRHYDCMSLGDIKALPVEKLAADDCALFLWVIKPLLPQALEVMAAWGFQYKTIAFTWVKTRPSGKEFINTGYWTRGNPELCLLGTRGKPRRVDCGVRELIEDHFGAAFGGCDTLYSHIREHSRKPDEARERIARLMGPGPGLVELFARTESPGWKAWGDQTKKFITGAVQAAEGGAHGGC